MKQTFETFMEFGAWEIGNLTKSEPSCFNSMVRVKKYRVTIEEVEESDEVIRQRLVDLWDHCDNMHHSRPLINAAKIYGLDLTQRQRGTKAGKRNNKGAK